MRRFRLPAEKVPRVRALESQLRKPDTWGGGPLAEERLNSNFYDESDRQIWHVPTFSR